MRPTLCSRLRDRSSASPANWTGTDAGLRNILKYTARYHPYFDPLQHFQQCYNERC